MTMPYAFIKALNGEKPCLKKNNRRPQEQANWLQKDNMQGQYLGACLDSCRWGGRTTVLYDMSPRQLVKFVQNWMNQNTNFKNRFHELPINGMYSKLELPYVKHDNCPSDSNHNRKIEDLGGRLRCAEFENKLFKPNYVHSYSHFNDSTKISRTEYFELDVTKPDSEQFPYEPDYQKQTDKWNAFEAEEPTFEVRDYCYSIIDEGKPILSLETIITRLNLRPETENEQCRSDGCERWNTLSKEEKECRNPNFCHGHTIPQTKSEFPFDGWTLALYVQKWQEQKNAPLINS